MEINGLTFRMAFDKKHNSITLFAFDKETIGSSAPKNCLMGSDLNKSVHNKGVKVKKFTYAIWGLEGLSNEFRSKEKKELHGFAWWLERHPMKTIKYIEALVLNNLQQPK